MSGNKHEESARDLANDKGPFARLPAQPRPIEVSAASEPAWSSAELQLYADFGKLLGHWEA